VVVAARHLVLAVALLACAAAAPVCAGDGDGEPKYFTLHAFGDGVFGAVGRPGSGAGSNAGFVIGDDCVTVVDTFQKAEAATELLAAIRARTELPVRFVVNTHYHLDHVAGNGVFREAGAVILAQRNENLKWWGDAVPDAARKLVESLVLPGLTYDAGVDLHLGERRLAVRSLPGHTGGDSIVVVPDAGVVFCGDLFWNHTLPNTIDADTQAWVATVDELVADHPDATFLPGHGEPGKADDVRTFGGYLRALRADVAKAVAAGEHGDAVVDDVLPRIREEYGSWAFFDHFAKDNIIQAEAEQRGTKRRPGTP
jgi:glyoxylase-like metal-dependent hydrolase (beta-lactamase superfamily II)